MLLSSTKSQQFYPLALLEKRKKEKKRQKPSYREGADFFHSVAAKLEEFQLIFIVDKNA